MSPNDSNQKRITELQTQKYSLTSQLNRLKDSKQVFDMKNKSVGGANADASLAKGEGGFKIYHLLFMGVLGLILGAYLRLQLNL
mmetsp:Transcript_4332/g.7314  ORF Transcript_4332/g.7314 Transcript_4332/m.7314 type:complete len:84 (+) Transcript_4332:799-1050(+)|eukprot:CAMPEP_0168623708 /NCGR_PEP_ID=MMETSP0449_2-20121227/8977_1 /TAXON_ID=1082188 /ORGANISM="Strombidium rassoulzadegani, Strain ras09" /LENGTH=83 /DNA_ID=CAMNT_0008665123 /DNA_START=746 /DNA_END=997 /DNA_ORIENTATION=-